MSDDRWSSSVSDIFADLPSYTPPPLDSNEFEEDVLKTLEKLRRGHPTSHVARYSFPSLSNYLSQSTYSTPPGLTEDISNTEYSSMSVFMPNYLPIFDTAFRDIVSGSEDIMLILSRMP